MSKGELFKWAAHDDVIRPAFLSRCVGAFNAFDVPPAIVHPKAEFIDEEGQVIRPDMDRMHASSNYSWIRGFQTLQAMNMTAPVAGVFHKGTLEKTSLIGSFIGSDYVLLLETGLRGKIIQLDGEPLFQRRIHSEMSHKANLSDREVLQWFDPQARVSLSRRRKLYLEYVRSPRRLDESTWMERALCVTAIVSGVAFRRTRVFLGKHRHRLLARFATEGS
jgi:hypothetical protein